MFSVDDQVMEGDQSNEYTMNLTSHTGIPLEYVEFELKHSKVSDYQYLISSLYSD